MKFTRDEVRFETIRIYAHRIGGHSAHLLDDDPQRREAALRRIGIDLDEILEICGKEKPGLTLRQRFERLGRRMTAFTARMDARIDRACAWISNLIG